MTEQRSQNFRVTSIILTSFLLLCLVTVPLVFADVNNGWALEPNGGGTSIFYELEKNLEDSQEFANVYNITTAGNEFNIPVFCDSDGDGDTEMITYEGDVISIHGLDGGNNIVLEDQMQVNFTTMIGYTPSGSKITSVACVDLRGDTINQDVIILTQGVVNDSSIVGVFIHESQNTNTPTTIVDGSSYELYGYRQNVAPAENKITCQEMQTINGFPLLGTTNQEYECAFTGDGTTWYIESISRFSDISASIDYEQFSHFDFNRWDIPLLSDSYQNIYAIGQGSGVKRYLYATGKATERMLGFTLNNTLFNDNPTKTSMTFDLDSSGAGSFADGVEYGSIQMVDLYDNNQLYPCIFGLSTTGGSFSNALYWTDEGWGVLECFNQDLSFKEVAQYQDDNNRQQFFTAVSWHNWDTYLPNFRDGMIWNYVEEFNDFGLYTQGIHSPPSFIPPSVSEFNTGCSLHLSAQGFSCNGEALLKTAVSQTEDIPFTIVYAVGNALVTFNLNETLPQYYNYSHSKYSSNMFVDFNNDFGLEWVSYDQKSGDIIIYTDLVTTPPPQADNIQLQNTSRVGDGYYGFYEGVNCDSSVITFYALEGTGQEYTYNSTVPTSQERICTTCGDTIAEFCGAYSFNSPQVSCNLTTGNYSINLYIESDEIPGQQQGIMQPALPLEVAPGTFGLDCNILDELIIDPEVAPPDIDQDQLGDNTTDPLVGEPPTNGEEPTAVGSVDELLTLVFGNSSPLFKFIGAVLIIMGMAIFAHNRASGNNVITVIGGALGVGISIIAGLLSIEVAIIGVVLLVLVAFALHKFQHPTLTQ